MKICKIHKIKDPRKFSGIRYMYLLEPVLEPDELQCAILVENVLITEEVQLQQQTTGTRRQRESKKDLSFFFFFSGAKYV